MPSEAPYYVMLSFIYNSKEQFLCGGSIIHPQWILSAAHCNLDRLEIAGIEVELDIYAHAGLYDYFVRPYEQVVRVNELVRHEEFAYSENFVPVSDIALFYLEKPFILNNHVGVIALPLTAVKPTGSCVLYGFGSITHNVSETASVLQTVTTEVISLEECANSFPVNFTVILHPNNICTGSGDQYIAACHGDSGGPLVKKINETPVLIGVTSWGYTPCGVYNTPSVFADVGYFLEWIRNKLDS